MCMNRPKPFWFRLVGEKVCLATARAAPVHLQYYYSDEVWYVHCDV